MEISLQERIYNITQECLPGLSIECVILGYDDHQLKTLIFKSRGEFSYSLPGGFIQNEEDVEEAAARIVQDRTGLVSLYLKQFHVFGAKNKSYTQLGNYPGQLDSLMQKLGIAENQAIKDWFSKRLVTIGFYALVEIQKQHPIADPLFESCEWISVEELPDLFLAQNETVKKALEHIRIQLHYQPISQSLLPDKFTMSELQNLYEIILGKNLVRSNFQRKMLGLGFFIRKEKKKTGSANKAPFLYSFDQEKYEIALLQGIGFRL
jgi:8-oxo-dGTP diphosphatase